MKRITFRVDEKLLEEAREAARESGTRLNDEARKWLAAYAAGTPAPSSIRSEAQDKQDD